MRAFDRRPSMLASTSDNNPQADNALVRINSASHSAGTKRARSQNSSSSDDNGSSPDLPLHEGTILKMLEEIDWD